MGLLTPTYCPLHPELLDNVLDYLSPPDLCSLLTVNKYFLRVCAKRLYSNPIETLLSIQEEQHRRRQDSPNNGDLAEEATEKLVALILRWSPSRDTHLSVPPEVPTIDYLSLIQSMPYHATLLGPGSALFLRGLLAPTANKPAHSMRLYATVAWAACGHQLANLRDLTIPCRDIDQYLPHVDKLIHMRSITLHLHDIPQDSPSSWMAAEMALVEQDLERALAFMTQWHDAYYTTTTTTTTIETTTAGAQTTSDRFDQGPADIRLVGGASEGPWWAWGPAAQTLAAIFELMPVSVIPFLGYQERLEWARFVLAPETVDLSQVQEIESYELSQEYGGAVLWPQHSSMSSILQQCPSLRYLGVSLGEDDGDAFAWAVQERQRRRREQQQQQQQRRARVLPYNHHNHHSHSHPVPRIPQLESLVLSLRGHWRHLQPWNDGLFAFGSTLHQLVIDDPFACHTIDLCLIRNLPELRHVKLRVRAFDCIGPEQCFSGCPKLETVTLANTEWSHHRIRPWHLPSVMLLDISGPLCYQFDQATLANMPKLDQFRLLNRAVDHGGGGAHIQGEGGGVGVGEGGVSEGVGAGAGAGAGESAGTGASAGAGEEGSDGSSIPQPFIWKLDYWLPAHLRVLSLLGTTALAFRWHMLAQCPRLQILSLIGTMDPVDVASVELSLLPPLPPLPPLEEDEESNLTQDRRVVAKSVHALALEGWTVSPEALTRFLPRLFPRLKTLSVRSCDTFTLDHQDALKGAFRHLKNLEVWHPTLIPTA
ncbi:hypothetical protein BGZ73_007010 [Actinomortierella ambigua]|nr:hypothetical protein BGZ73_007010 [Actinomortierella ambigua]